MSGIGSPGMLPINGSLLKVAIIAASWHEEIMQGLIVGANKYLTSCGVEQIEVIRVPGSFELPLAAKLTLQDKYDAAVALGLILRGDTPHFDYVSTGVTNGLMQVMLETNKPIGFGVLTCDSLNQAIDRSGLPGSNSDKGAEAAHAAVSLSNLIRGI